jgi:hypothetical protein
MRLIFLLLTLCSLAQAQSESMIELTLLIEAEEGILFNHVNPVVFSLYTHDAKLEQEAIGIEFAGEPEVYWETLNPVVWTLELPNKRLEIEITANLALCDKQHGICYIEPVSIKKVLNKKVEKEIVTLRLQRPQY